MKPDNPYLSLLKATLTDLHRCGKPEYTPVLSHRGKLKMKILILVSGLLGKCGFAVCKIQHPTIEKRLEGRDWPGQAETMIGIKRLDNIYLLMEDVIAKDIQGSFIETGAWRGGACIWMNAIIQQHPERTDRTIYVADSFEGLPKPDGRYSADAGDRHWEYNELAVSIEEVMANFEKYGLLTQNVQFLKGWFKDTLPTINDKFAIIRLDGDMYGSTMDALKSLYPKLSKGGFCIIDDYHPVMGCRMAVRVYRGMMGIKSPIQEIDGMGIYWKKE